MASKRSKQVAPLLSGEERRALAILAKLLPEQPDISLKSHNLKDDGLNLLRRVVKRLSKEIINRG